MVDEVKETNHDGEKPEKETGEENKYLLPDKAYKAVTCSRHLTASRSEGGLPAQGS